MADDNDDSISQDQINRESKYNQLLATRARIERDRLRNLSLINRETTKYVDLQSEILDQTKDMVKAQRSFNSEFEKSVKLFKDNMSLFKKLNLESGKIADKWSNATTKNIQNAKALAQVQKQLAAVNKTKPNQTSTQAQTPTRTPGTGGAMARSLAAQSQARCARPPGASSGAGDQSTSMLQSLSNFANAVVDPIVKELDKLGNKLQGIFSWIWQEVKKMLLDDATRSARLMRLGAGDRLLRSDPTSAVAATNRLIDRTNAIAEQLAEISSGSDIYDFRQMFPDVLIETQLMRTSASADDTARTLGRLMEVSTQLKEIADVDIMESVDLVRSRAMAAGRGTAQDIERETRRLAQLAEIPAVIESNLARAGVSVGRFAFTFRRDFLKLMMETNRQLEGQASNLVVVGSQMAYVAQEATRLGASVESATKLAKAFRDVMYPERDDAISFLAGEQLADQFRRAPEELMESFRRAGMDPHAIEEIRGALQEGGPLGGLEAINIARQTAEGQRAISNTIDSLVGHLDTTTRRLLLRDAGYVSSDLDTMQGRQMVRLLSESVANAIPDSGDQVTRDVSAAARDIADSARQISSTSFGERVEGLRTTALMERPFGRFTDEVRGLVQNLLPSLETISTWLPQIAESLSGMNTLWTGSREGVRSTSLDIAETLASLGRADGMAAVGAYRRVSDINSRSGGELELEAGRQLADGSMEIRGRLKGMTNAVGAANSQMMEDAPDGL